MFMFLSLCLPVLVHGSVHEYAYSCSCPCVFLSTVLFMSTRIPALVHACSCSCL
ncbi:hypothetical protein B0O80DRAFT_471506 [Mortierella sp. GBAus27b]|nr:hypothetical protein B0O80DRAFT_471506 [Mortierella sp. GBAus27b]